MKQYEAVIETLEMLGGVATLGELNKEVFKIKDCEWRTKTPFASIRRIVQQTKGIYKIKPGLYVSIRPTTGIKPLYTTIATVTMNLIVSAAIVLLNPYVTIYISY